jgi:hypothetical protein
MGVAETVRQPTPLVPITPHTTVVLHTFPQCYIPSIVNATCEVATGPVCQQYGADTSFDQPIACCNKLVQILSSVTAGVSLVFSVLLGGSVLCETLLYLGT